jgi:hypothetical protein
MPVLMPSSKPRRFRRPSVINHRQDAVVDAVTIPVTGSCYRPLARPRCRLESLADPRIESPAPREGGCSLQQPPSPRCPLLRSLYAKQVIPAVTNTLDGDPDHSILKSEITLTYFACLQSLFQDAGFSTRARNIPPVTTTGNKTIVGDLEVLGANMGDPKMRNLIVDVSIVHEFQGNDAAQDRNWVLRHQDLDRALNLRAQKKVAKYRDGYLPCP